MDIEKAMLDAASVFASPDAVVRDQSITREQKIKILKRWAYDARELEVAEEENMRGGPPSMLGEILNALHSLESDSDTEHSAPTKQGG
jgi:hypothetical protein